MTEDSLSDATDELGLETILLTGASDGSLALAGGGAFVLAGVRSVARGRFRAIGQLALAGGLLKLGQYQRRDRGGTAIERALDPRGEDASRNDDPDSDIEFSEDADELSRSRPGVEGENDPRRKTDGDAVKIDVSDPALADESGEATGPDPEQAQPSQTEGTEPEETVDEDVSHMRADTPDGPHTDDENGNSPERDVDSEGDGDQ